jgi:acyl-CoA reductase-like NAD-dependent aldehyde dehydrogenase
MDTYTFLIDGQAVQGARQSPVINPATEEVVSMAPRASQAQLEQAVDAAQRAFAGWQATPIAARAELLRAAAAQIEANRDTLAQLLTLEQGKPLRRAHGEVKAAAAFFRYFASLDLADRPIEDSPARSVRMRRRALGVVAAILPWNYPIMTLAGKLPPCLLAGNTLVLKPAPTTPLATLKLGEILRPLLPPGVLNIVADDNDLGAALAGHPAVRKVTFTGSTGTGRKVMAGAASTLKRLTLELGGNDAGIVLDDVDVDRVAPQIYQSAFENSGQVCLALKRLYVHEKVHDRLCDALAALAAKAVVGNGMTPGVEFGPLQNRMQFERVRALIEDARQAGTVIAGGEVHDGPGYFIRPTIVRDLSNGSRLVDEEQFGPVLPVIRVADEEEALRLANDSPYGLGGSAWSGDEERGAEVAARLEAGTVWVNRHQDIAAHIPFGGAKQSGFGVEFAAEGLQEFTQMQVLHRPGRSEPTAGASGPRP